jgi:hypothetical protein
VYKLVFPGIILHLLRLSFLGYKNIFHHQVVHLGAHEAPVGIFRGSDNRFTTYIKRGIDQYRTAGARFEMADQVMKTGIGFLMNRLDAG